MKLRFFYLLLVLFFSFAFAVAQNNTLHPCGTKDGKVSWLRAYQQNPAGFPRTNDTLYIPLTIHVVGTNEGTGHYPARKVLDAFCTLNNDFKASAIQFFIEGDINYLNNSSWFDHDYGQGSQMMAFNFVPNTINCYIVDSPAGNCGYSSYNSGVALAQNCVDPGDHTWAHEIGHYLSLPHPFWGWEGYEHNYNQPAPSQIDDAVVERMDGQFCNFAGDGFCDTPPDYLNFRWGCNDQGMSNTIQKDPNGVEFRSDGSLFMSYSVDDCPPSRFSDEQIDAMRANILTEKESFLYNQTPLDPPVLTPLVAISPVEDQIVPTYQEVVFAWEPIENATHYLLEVSPMGTFGVIQGRYEVEGNSYVSTDLDPNRTYYWRVRPYNRRHTCTDYLEGPRFETGELTAVAEIESISSVNVLPNPSRRGQEVQMVVNASESLDLTVQVNALSGQQLQQFQWQVTPGVNQRTINADVLPAGIYLLSMQSQRGVMTRKLVVSGD